MLKVKDLRDSYIEFFKSKGHRHIHSSSLIPKDDPTLLFTTAGMVQFKANFAGTIKTDYTTATTIQKCLRTSDLENVGRTERHCTFFEMLGNFSFGDYFKEKAIEYAWEYSVDVLKFDSNLIWVSIYQDDDEAFEIWNKKIGIPAERIVRLGKADNFWGPAGDSGACGPCSELYIDKGPEHGCGSPDCKPGCDCERYMEYWNLVFNQFNQDTNGKLNPLPQTGIDTGMGLERLATICQGVTSIYDTDEFKRLIDFVCRQLNVKYEGRNKTSINVIVEHSRALTFTMSDGAYPSNEGRGYVLRRILRRALRFGRYLGIKEPFIYKMVDPIVEIMGDYYPELKAAAPNIKNVLMGEEKRFLETLETGMQILEGMLSDLTEKKLTEMPGRDAFVLYDTYGFPAEMTNEMAEEKGIHVNMKEFETAMEEQRQRGKQSWKGADNNLEALMNEISSKCGVTDFTGYTQYSSESEVILITDESKICSSLKTGQQGFIILKSTPFYGESGGQKGDKGRIEFSTDAVFRVFDTKKINKTIVHSGIVEKGIISTGDKCSANIERIERNLIKANHTVTHLLQAALRKTLGDHVKQAGSQVEAERMRFDFSHFEAMTPEQISEVESLVNRKIWEDLEVTTSEMKLEDALKTGAMAEFGEKYENSVRVIKCGDFSTELCGGTHVSSTGKIGLFKIMKESSPGAGMRRIEGITLKGLLDRFNNLDGIISESEKIMNVSEKDIISKVDDLIKTNLKLKKDISRIESASLASGMDDILAAGIEQNGFKIYAANLGNAKVNDMRDLSDKIREKDQNSIVLFASDTEGKAMLLCAATKKVVDNSKADCGAVIKEISQIVGGGGGGRRDMAQAGGKNSSELDKALKRGIEIIKGMI
ncbi:MAG: alanine--tRNA ligase [Spirochaetes bacterium]|nr:alanine--tRNA ligase [Spirochaetota bacterium]